MILPRASGSALTWVEERQVIRNLSEKRHVLRETAG